MKTPTKFIVRCIILQTTKLVKEIKSLNQEFDYLTNKIVESFSEEKSDLDNLNPLKRSRGRPRKIIDVTSLKRGRGRPRKVKPDDKNISSEKKCFISKSLALIPSENKKLALIPFNDKNLSLIPFVDKESLNSVKKRSFNWMDFSTGRSHAIIEVEDVIDEINLFFDYYIEHYSSHIYYEILIKIHFSNGQFRTLLRAQRASIFIYDMDRLRRLILLLFRDMDEQTLFSRISGETLDNTYIENKNRYLPGGTIHFLFKSSELFKTTRYSKKAGSNNKNINVKIAKIAKNEIVRNFKYEGITLPIHMDLTLWPNLILNNDYTRGKGYIVEKGSNKVEFEYLIFISEKFYRIEINKNGVRVLTVKDHLSDIANLTNFKREIVELDHFGYDQIKETFFFKNGKEIAHTISSDKIRFIRSNLKDSFMNDRIMTLDIETRIIKGKITPVCISFYDGKNAWTFTFKDPKNWFLDIQEAIKSIMLVKYNYYHVYVHNFSYFDGIFMVDALSKVGKVKPILRDNKIIKLKFMFDWISVKDENVRNKGTIYFYDSYLILSSSLKALSSNFKIDTPKIDFPLKFLNEPNFNIDYVGEVPDYKYFYKANTPHFTPSDYNNYKSKYKNWNLIKELSAYCETDCIALYQIVKKFNSEIFETFQVDPGKYPTTPSLAYGIFRSSFLKDKTKIPIIVGKKYNNISKAYYGGITDYYQVEGRDVNSYDVNSLYPYCMWKYDMPIGVPIYFKGDPYSINSNPFGFFHVEVFSPERKVPILPFRKHEKKDSGTAYPIGFWKGWYFSEEIKNAEIYGYKFKIVEGYLFERENIFKDYISKLYAMRIESHPSDPKNKIAKLLMNSLYGRFGMDPNLEEHKIVSPQESEKIINENSNVNVVNLDSGNVLVSYTPGGMIEELKISDVSVGISAAIASYARIVMSHYLIKYENSIICCDTDGIKLSCELDPTEIHHNQLGKMKYEYTFKCMVSPGAKVYGGVLKNRYKGLDEIVKIKGVSQPISYYQLSTILYKDNPLKIEQERWRRMMTQSTILIQDQKYTLGTNENKRELLYDSNKKVITTFPLIVKDGIVIRRNLPLLYYLPSPTWFILVTRLLARVKETISIPFFQVLSIIKYTEALPLHPFIIFIIPIHLFPYNILIPFILSTIPHNLRPYIIFIIPNNLVPYIIYIMPLNLIPFIIYIMPLDLVPFIIYITPLYLIYLIRKSLAIIPFIIYITPLYLNPFVNKGVGVIPFVIYITPLHLVPSIFYMKDVDKEVDSINPKKRGRGRPRKVDLFISPDGVAYLHRRDIPKRPRGRPPITVPPLGGKRAPPPFLLISNKLGRKENGGVVC